jgi:cytochrome c oxidase accessory protein FixG
VNTTPPKVIPIVSEEVLVPLYASQKKIYPRSVSGLFSRWRWGVVLLTQLVFYGLPWLQWGQRQAVLFDLGARRFYIFNLVLYPQDFIYLTGLLVISALSLFLFTAVAGRLWCGFACPQTVYTEIFLWIERWVEGDRQARMRRDAAPLSLEKALKKSTKHGLWLLLAFWTGISFVGYFSPIRGLWAEAVGYQLGAWEIFWILFYGFATYGNAGFMREQVCKYMCPYARFQSAMFDKDTLIVSYDAERGEPRGKLSRHAAAQTAQQGQCVDCTLCVQVCPTGIDIRNGLQYECIGCGSCIDVCDEVMDKVQFPRGLIRFTTQSAMTQHGDMDSIVQHIFRPRVGVYLLILFALTASVLGGLLTRMPLKVDVVRDRGVLARLVEGGRLENVYSLQIMNATELPQTYRLEVEGLPGLTVASEREVRVGPAESRWVPVRLQIEDGSAESGSHPVRFLVTEEDDHQKKSIHVTEKTTFLVPR